MTIITKKNFTFFMQASPIIESKNFQQYEAVFLQLADEHRTISAFELQELLEACLPNGDDTCQKNIFTRNNFVNIFPQHMFNSMFISNLNIIVFLYRLHQKLCYVGCLPSSDHCNGCMIKNMIVICPLDA